MNYRFIFHDVGQPPHIFKNDGGASAIIGGGLALAGGLANTFTAGQSKSLTREGWRLQQAENEKNRQYMSDEWDRQFNLQNEYNTPAAQIERLMDAGLNPNLVFGGGTNTTAMSSGSPQAAAGSSIPISSPLPLNLGGSGFISDVAKSVQLFSEALKNEELTPVQRENIEATTDNLVQDTNKKVAETQKAQTEAHLLRAYGSAINQREVQELDSRIKLNLNMADKAIADKDYAKALEGLTSIEGDLKKSQKYFTDTQSNALNDVLSLELSERRERINNLRSQTDLNVATTDRTLSETEGQRFANIIKGLAAERDLAEQTDKIDSDLEVLRRERLITDQQMQALKKAQKDNDTYVFRLILQSVVDGSTALKNIMPTIIKF